MNTVQTNSYRGFEINVIENEWNRYQYTISDDGNTIADTLPKNPSTDIETGGFVSAAQADAMAKKQINELMRKGF